MLAKKQRLTKHKDFDKTFKQGKSYYSKMLGIKATVNQLAVNRYGIVISTKVSKKAVDRNRLKRQIRAAVKQLDEQLIQGVDLIIMSLPTMLNQNSKTIKSELEKIFAKLKLFN